MLGFHISKHNRKMHEALDDVFLASKYGYKNIGCQIFVTGPQSFRETLGPEEKTVVAKFVREKKISIIIHGSYLDNPWSETPGKAYLGLQNIIREVNIAEQIGAAGVIIHLGKGAVNIKVLNFVIKVLNKIDPKLKATIPIYLEINSAKSAEWTFETPAKLLALFARINEIQAEYPEPINFGLCIDTAHLFACGVSLADAAAAKNWLSELEDNWPKMWPNWQPAAARPVMFHLNDSKSTMGSGVDRHEALCRGNIWANYAEDGPLKFPDSGLMTILAWAAAKNAMMILERAEGVENDIKLISTALAE